MTDLVVCTHCRSSYLFAKKLNVYSIFCLKHPKTMGTTGEIGHLCHKSADDFIYFDSFRNAQKYGMLCMESNGRIAPMARTVFFGGPGQIRGEKRCVLHLPDCLRRGMSAKFQGGGGGDPVGFPRPIRKRIILKEL